MFQMMDMVAASIKKNHFFKVKNEWFWLAMLVGMAVCIGITLVKGLAKAFIQLNETLKAKSLAQQNQPTNVISFADYQMKHQQHQAKTK